ncbi:zinc finger protein basonuclin-1-like [Corythoichthys intestinalis]|uniref:zinc finger protein basonuclin-1-like n=1 Tax=Corythoichthys intestinalis TaxID=161448 RepID=UPI0025A5DBA7|nr:zinc finger protein basonuclin-1-like [Corythoichthys intestinalis]
MFGICCTLLNCNCENFKPCKMKQRQCENCMHGWVAHALSKLKVHHMYHNSQVEIVHSDVVFDICSLMLYGTHAIPVRLKILLDRLFSVLKQEEVIKILNALEWTLQDYIRGYILQDVAGKVLDRWAIMTYEEEIATLQQFLRFGETKSIVEVMALQDRQGQAVLVPSTRTISDIRNFIERNSPCPTAVSTIKEEKQNGENMHHFENLINSMAFIVPFQLLSSVPAPFLGSPASLSHQRQQIYKEYCHRSVDHQSQRQVDQDQNSHASQNPPCSTDISHIDAHSVICSEDQDKSIECISWTKMVETEDFLTSDNCSDVPMTSDSTQFSPSSKLHNRRSGVGILVSSGSGGSLKKSRVFCNACEKTFYDKGTLKIHYNAVHLKIKHKCTIEGCNMVFSSLRSRNRHSANPNPRLHMPMNRNNRDRDIRYSMHTYERPAETPSGYDTSISICSAESHKSVPSAFQGMSQSGLLFPNLKTVQPVLPFYRSPVTPAELVSTPGTQPSPSLIASSTSVKLAAVPEPLPQSKKKSRKSNTPIKIEKEMVARDDQVDQESHLEEDILSWEGDYEECEGHRAGGQMCFVTNKMKTQEKTRYFDEVRERKGSKSLLDHAIGMLTGEHKDDITQKVETVTTITSHLKNKLIKSLRDNQSASQECCFNEESDSKECQNALQGDDHFSKLQWREQRMTDRNGFQLSDDQKKEGSQANENSSPSDLDLKADQFHDYETTFKNHDKVNGCPATFSSRGSRDRHSANFYLYHKLKTKDHENQKNFLYAYSTCCKERECVPMDDCQNQDLGYQDPTCQKNVTFGGHNNMGLVYPISKFPAPLEMTETFNKADVRFLKGGSDDSKVLNPSSSSIPTHCSKNGRYCWENDVDIEEGARPDENLKVFHMKDSDGSFIGKTMGGTFLHREGELLNSVGEAHKVLRFGSPITCHICQKVYSNKGVFRAHYKTVHLKMLHKCKIPGCETTFSSVRSRNRHSQNSNLHRKVMESKCSSIDKA